MPFISGIFIAGNYVTVNKNEAVEWHDVVMELRILITEFLNEGGAILNQPPDVISNPSTDPGPSSEERKELNELDLKISDILDEHIRPAVEQDGGAISFHSFDEGTVTVNLRGACSGCPSAALTLKSGIETVLKRLVPEVKEVVALEL
jgi:Fe-S cluster biogenesis protein NfuA